MSFFGKKFKRVRTENMDEILEATNVSDNIKHMLLGSSPTFQFTRIDENTINFKLETPNRVTSHDCKLGEEQETERRDGSKVLVTYTLEGDNVLKQVIKAPDGKISHFKREFGEKDAKLTITLHDIGKQATIYYELVE